MRNKQGQAICTCGAAWTGYRDYLQHVVSEHHGVLPKVERSINYAQVLMIICGHWIEHGFPPTLDEIALAIGRNKGGSISHVVRSLARSGFLRLPVGFQGPSRAIDCRPAIFWSSYPKNGAAHATEDAIINNESILGFIAAAHGITLDEAQALLPADVVTGDTVPC